MLKTFQILTGFIDKSLMFKAPFGSKELQRKIAGIGNGGKEVCVSIWNGGIGSSFGIL